MRLRKEQLFRYRKYLTLSLPHITVKKILNMAKVEWKLKTNNPDVKGLYPYILFVDLYNTCNLRCPLCIMGRREVQPREPLMNSGNYKRIIEPLKDYLFQVFLYNNSEPFLNKDIYDIIACNRHLNIGSVVSSNLSLKVNSGRIVESGLEYLIVSADGLRQDVYEKYRVNGRIDLVIENIKKIIEARKKAHSKTPFIEWQCLVTSKNENQLDTIRNFAYKIGVDTVRFANINFYSNQDEIKKMEEEWLPEKKEFRSFESHERSYNNNRKRLPCHWLWRTAIINSNGGVIPCCLYDTEDWGNVFEESFSTVWNNEKYSKARYLSNKNTFSGPGIICDNCQADFIRS